jgi:hypothetical protein
METIYQTIIKVMRDIEAIEKSRKNQAQGYVFRGIDDAYNSLHSIFAKHGLFTITRVVSERTEEKTSAKGGILIYRILQIEFDFINETGEKLTCSVIGEGLDSGDKATNKALAVAHKYALMQTFLIPTEELKDPENDSHEIKDDRNERIKNLIALAKNKGFTELEISEILMTREIYNATDSNYIKLKNIVNKQ